MSRTINSHVQITTYSGISEPAFSSGMPYSLKAISIGYMGGVIIFEVSESIILELLFSGRETSKIITLQASVEFF